MMIPISFLDQILTFYIVFENEQIVYKSKNFKNINDIFCLSFLNPVVDKINNETFNTLKEESLFFTVDQEKKMSMKGQLIKYDDYYLLICNPMVYKFDDFKKFKIDSSFFPKFDTTSDLILSLDVQEKVIDKLKNNLDTEMTHQAIILDEFEFIQNDLLENEKHIALEHLINGLSNEINNPIAAIKTNNDLLKNDLKSFFKFAQKTLSYLKDDEKNFFYETLESSLQNKERLTYKEKRHRKKLIEIEISDFCETEIEKETLSEKFCSVGLLPPFNIYFTKIDREKLNLILELIEKVYNYYNSFSIIENSVDKVSRTVFSLSHYLENKKTDNFLISEIDSQFKNVLSIYESSIIGKIILEKNCKPEIGKIKISDELMEVWKIVIYNSIQVESFFKKEITIDIYQETKGQLCVEIKDNGQGISRENQKKIFTAFFTTKTNGEGIGLGLYTAKKIIERYNGEISFFSDFTGTIFKIVIPI